MHGKSINYEKKNQQWINNRQTHGMDLKFFQKERKP